MEIIFIAVSCQELLRDDHEWVRLGALRFLQKYLSSVDLKAVALLASKKLDKEEKRFLYSNARQSVKTLCLDLIDQIIPGHEILDEILKEVNNVIFVYSFMFLIEKCIHFQTMGNLLLLADILKLVQSKKVKDDRNELSLGWLLKNLNKLVYIEVSKHPQHHTVVITIHFSNNFFFINILSSTILKCSENTFFIIFKYLLHVYTLHLMCLIGLEKNGV